MEIDITKKRHYKYNVSKDQTEKRLKELIALRFIETEDLTFGIPNVIIWLHIDRIWNDVDYVWKDYINWVKRVIDKNKKL